jgi:SAM-dependent methyltransferase
MPRAVSSTTTRILQGIASNAATVVSAHKTPFHVNWLVERLHTEAVGRCVQAHAMGRLLDVGCGSRPFRELLLAHSRAAFGVEIDRERYGRVGAESGEQLVAETEPNEDVPQPDAWADGMQLPFGGGVFDTVVSFQVLEHVPEPSQLMAEMARVLAPGGKLVLTAPHIWGIHEEPHDYYRFTPFGLRHLAQKAGFEVEEVAPLAGYWVTHAARFCHYLQQFEKIGLHPLTRPLMALSQVTCLLLDRLHPVYSDAWNHLLVARRILDTDAA